MSMNKESEDYLLLSRIKNKDQQAFDEFYAKNEPLVYSLLQKYAHKAKDYEELVMCAKYGLVLAIYNFDLSYDVMFSTYAVPMILGEIKKYFKNLSAVKISRRFQDLRKKINEANDLLHEQYNRSPTVEEISAFLDEPSEDILEAMSSFLPIGSLDESVNEDTLRIEMIKDDSLSIIDRMDLNLALEGLNKKERLIIELRYFDGLTQQEVSERLHISQVQVSRIEAKTLNRLKEMMF